MLHCRMDLAAARSGDSAAVARERARFTRAIQPLLQHDGPKLLVTDSQVSPKGIVVLCCVMLYDITKWATRGIPVGIHRAAQLRNGLVWGCGVEVFPWIWSCTMRVFEVALQKVLCHVSPGSCC